MKRALIACALLLALSLPCLAAPPDDPAAIRKIMTDQALAWTRGDVNSFMQAYEDSPETTFIGAQIGKGYERILHRYQQNYTNAAQMGHLTFSEIDVRMLPSKCGAPEFALVTGRFHLERKEKGAATKDDGIFSLVWRRTATGWKIVLDHTS
jgi:ketosteroid isomerase-like protein